MVTDAEQFLFSVLDKIVSDFAPDYRNVRLKHSNMARAKDWIEGC